MKKYQNNLPISSCIIRFQRIRLFFL